MLIHVCRRWRDIVFASRLRLNLRLYCNGSKPVKEMLDIWPPLPIVIECYHGSEQVADNIIAALEHNDRVREISMDIEEEVSRSLLERFARAMQKPFPQLTDLKLQLADETALVLPKTLLDGSATRLRKCVLDYLPFASLRKLLFSASRLVHLRLWDIPHSGYISPEEMVTCLSAATSLESLRLGFQPHRSRPNHATRRLPPLMRTILPALTDFVFCGVSEYSEDFISRVDAPLLDNVDIMLFHQLNFDVSQLHQFIGRTKALSALKIANVVLDDGYAGVELSDQIVVRSRLKIGQSLWRNKSDWQLSFLAKACSSLSPTLSTFETLSVCESQNPLPRQGWEDDIENSQWLEMFHPFTSVKNLYLSKKLATRVLPALQQLAGERVTHVLPMLQKVCLEGLQPLGPAHEGIGQQLVAARQLLNQPVTVEPWDRLE